MNLKPEFIRAAELAAENIASYALMQLPAERSSTQEGRTVGWIVRPLDSMAAYIPAGRYPLPSTILMTVIPAQAAGVKNVCVTSPKPSQEILGLAAMRGVNNVFRIGGAHAIAGFAYGTESIPKVDRIVGPGNAYVAAAKKLIAGEVAIDFVAGPTELLVIAREGNPKWIAADMLAQAEHDADASAILITTSKELANSVAIEIESQLATLPTATVARQAINDNSAVVVVDGIDQAVEFSNQWAPEHLVLLEPELLNGVRSAGSVFLGHYSPEAAGDYASGPNHVLPTSGGARIRGGLSAADFVKLISVQSLTREALEAIAPAVTTLARTEGLEGHARSVEVRSS